MATALDCVSLLSAAMIALAAAPAGFTFVEFRASVAANKTEEQNASHARGEEMSPLAFPPVSFPSK